MATSGPLQEMFSAVPERYDRMNRLMTWGLDQRWRRRAARACLDVENPERVLDLCTGTGDLALHLARRADDDVEVVAADFAKPMLEVARRKARAAGLEHRIEFVQADAAALGFADASFGAIGIAFAFRNLVWRNPRAERHLAELARVIRPGGRCVVVETSQPRSRFLRAGYHLYMRAVAAPLAGLLAGQRGAYRYLSRSARGFYTALEVCDLFRQAGFSAVEHALLFGGVAAVHVATR